LKYTLPQDEKVFKIISSISRVEEAYPKLEAFVCAYRHLTNEQGTGETLPRLSQTILKAFSSKLKALHFHDETWTANVPPQLRIKLEEAMVPGSSLF